MVMKCEEMWREISNYIDGEVSPALKLAMDQHLAGCRQCQSVLDGARNVVHLYGDEKAFALPANFYPQLHNGLVDRVEGPRGRGTAWILGIAAAILLTATVLVAGVRDRGTPQLRAAMARPAIERIKAMVVVADDTKVFHVAGCEYIHGQPHTMSADEAVHEGYTPCVRCLHELYEQSARNLALRDNDVASKDPAMDID
ncbi:MAG TPA: zf-HC2 domain-containing protein [Candidatus Acidoferrales bacterium]